MGAKGGSASEPVQVEGIVTYDGRLPEPIHVAEAGTFRQLIEAAQTQEAEAATDEDKATETASEV